MPATNANRPDSDLIVCACTNLKMAARATGRLYDRALAPINLNAMQFAILNNIGKRGSILTMELAPMLSLERTTLYRALAILQRRGLVEARSGRGKEQLLSLTDEGQGLREQAMVLWQEIQEKFVAHFGNDWEAFLNHLRQARAFSEDANRHFPEGQVQPATAG